MGPLVSRVKLLAAFADELARYGLPEVSGSVDREVLFIVDGVGGFQAAPLMIRRALRLEGSTLGTILYKWQFGLPGEIWTDLMWLRRNRLMGMRLARRLLAFRRANPAAKIHVMACSGGAGITLFALEAMHRRSERAAHRSAEPIAPLVDTLILASPAVSPTYNLGSALGMVKRCYAIVSRRDSIVLGLGTRIFGTMDRSFTRAAGMVGFRMPTDVSPQEREAYERLREIRWSPELQKQGHNGGHTGSVSVAFLRHHLLPLLAGEPTCPVHVVSSDLPNPPVTR